ncbi:hypothetical protein BWI17_21470 [Betaproteobacteria bacterium GR16-43]|nr:hypothetical protein BWI17_21470 [Betaproteobacteria bacterium GR16-43]
MDTKTIAALLLKITGLVLIVYCVAQLPAFFAYTSLGYDFSIGQAIGAAAAALLPLTVLGLFLWFFPGTVANKIVSGTSEQSAPADTRSIELVALTILGVYLLTMGLVDVVRDIAFLIAIHRQDPGLTLIPASVVSRVAATIAELLIGAGLCVGAKGVSRVIERLRQTSQ